MVVLNSFGKYSHNEVIPVLRTFVFLLEPLFVNFLNFIKIIFNKVNSKSVKS